MGEVIPIKFYQPNIFKHATNILDGMQCVQINDEAENYISKYLNGIDEEEAVCDSIVLGASCVNCISILVDILKKYDEGERTEEDVILSLREVSNMIEERKFFETNP